MFILTVTVLMLIATATAHSHLAYPLPTRRLDCRVGNGRRVKCYGPCPPLDTYGRPTGVSPQRPAVTWRRGQRQTIKWHRNNHGNGESGFVRLSIVPVSKMFDKDAHRRYTTHITCWGSGLHRCYKRTVQVCGNDADGMAYQAHITVPTSYPDGVYAFGWAWYGGGDYRDRSFFGDYYSCSFVRIQGGVEVSAMWKPEFVPAPNLQYKDGCPAATNRVGVCVREPCNIGPVKPMHPAQLPDAIYASDFGETVKRSDNDVSNGGRNRGAEFRVLGMQAIDVRTRQTRVFSGDHFRINPNSYGNGYTLALRTEGRVLSVRFEGPGFAHTEYVAPFVINGNDGTLRPFRACRGRDTIVINCSVRGIRFTKEYQYRMSC